MEVRCRACNKLFRVADDKITGRGIKFPCTRCGEYVRITQEDFQNYTLSRSTVSVLDLFEPKPSPPTAPLSTESEGLLSKETPLPARDVMMFETAASSTHGDMREEAAPLFVEPVRSEVASMSEPEPAVESQPKPLTMFYPEDEPPVEPQPEPEQESKPLMEAEPKTVSSPTHPAQSSKPKKEISRPAVPTVSPASERTVMEPLYSSTPSRSGRMIFVLFGTLIILGLAGYGVFVYRQQSPKYPQKKVEEPAHEITSIEGLQIVNPAGAVDANGDLLVTGVIDNAADKERADWYVVLEVYDAQGAVLSKIRLLNGNQIYSQRDYDILAKRGANVPEIKAKILQGKGIVIPPKGRVNFEARYIQPTPGIASFVAQVVPFDRVQLNKEIAEEIR
jgi:zinc-ribbon domain